ncbi:MAG: penicillin-insensitive murein endopeptidase [Deltaproteobacteria bacterium]|nr:penicillin-insensitive murein endopeptidase [Deltaproteobacteria bacterium]
MVGMVVVFGVVGCAAFQPPELAPPGTSVGDSNEGWLEAGVLVPDRGDGFRAYRERERRYGSRRLTEVLEETAGWLQERWDGATLWIGDLSARSGGAVAGHHSHRAGRDVDLLFFTTSADGSAGRRARFMRFGEDGLAVGVAGPVSLDLERNWALVAHLLEEYPQDVQWIFVSHGVKAALLTYALESGASLDTVERAVSVLHQPSDSAPHDDHFHVRLYCSADDLPYGCADRPPIWPWVRRGFDRLEHAPTDDAVLLELALGEM